jgi:hypothetical protein
MRAYFDIDEVLEPTPAWGSRLLLVASLCLGLSILYQVYIYDFSEGVLVGGERPRLALKVVFMLLFMVAVRKHCSLAAFTMNFVLKIPLLFIAASIVAIAPFLISEYLQALNLLFFLPLLFVDWNLPGGRRLYRNIWAILVVIVVVQLLLDPLLKLYFKVGWSNAALIGGMGNPNVFGIFLVAAGLASALLLQQRFKYLSTVLFLTTILTGSLAATIIGFMCVLIQMVSVLIRTPSRTLLLLGLLAVLLPLSTVAISVVADARAITHAFNKFLVLTDLLTGGGGAESESVSIRMDYTQRGLSMIADSPLSVITGHPGGAPMYSGDGMWVALLVTYGLPLTLCFLLVNLTVIYRALRDGSRDLFFSGCMVTVTMAFLVTNRILDYWPSAFVYLLAFSYLTNRSVHRYELVEQFPTQRGRPDPSHATEAVDAVP